MFENLSPNGGCSQISLSPRRERVRVRGRK